MIVFPKLSVIVPVYKVEKYLPRCIESILEQIFPDFELILIDDGSPDNCPTICDAYAAKDFRIKVIHQTNAGVSVARNKGLDLASGQYITFVDSDDCLDVNCYARMLEAIERTQADMAICGFLYEYPDGQTELRSANGGDIFLSHHELVSCEFDIPWSIRTGTCNKLFKKELLQNIRFRTDLKCCEDTFFLHECLMQHRCSAVFIQEPYYINFQRPGSAMHGGLALEAIGESLAIHKRIAEETARIYPDLYAKAFAFYLDCCVWKMNANLSFDKTLTEEENSLLAVWSRKIRLRILSEWKDILRCSLIGWKQKVFYFLVALSLK